MRLHPLLHESHFDKECFVTKAEIVEHVADRVGLTRKESGELVESVFELMKKILEKGEPIKISGFGNFVVKKKHARRGRNPQTGEEITIEGRRVLAFKPSQILRNYVNNA